MDLLIVENLRHCRQVMTVPYRGRLTSTIKCMGEWLHTNQPPQWMESLAAEYDRGGGSFTSENGVSGLHLPTKPVDRERAVTSAACRGCSMERQDHLGKVSAHYTLDRPC